MNHPISEVSTFTTNGFVGTGCFKIYTVVIANVSLGFLSCGAPDEFWGRLFKMDVRGAASKLKYTKEAVIKVFFF